jgi:hypothetical protein
MLSAIDGKAWGPQAAAQLLNRQRPIPGRNFTTRRLI